MLVMCLPIFMCDGRVLAVVCLCVLAEVCLCVLADVGRCSNVLAGVFV